MFPSTLAPRVSRTERAGLLLTLALLLFAGITALVSLSGAPDNSAAAAAPAARSVDRSDVGHRLPPRERDGRVLVRLPDAGFLTATADRADPTVLHVLVPRGTGPLDCNLIGARVSVLRQDATSVRLLASGWEYVPAASARGGRGGTTCVQSGTAALTVRLTAPLGLREVYSGHAVRPVVSPGD